MSAKSNSIEVQREAAAALCNCALAEENKVVMARGGSVPALVSLAMSGDVQRETHASAALANIAEMVEGRTQDRMLEEGVLKPLMRLAESDDAEVRKKCREPLLSSPRSVILIQHLVRAHAATRIMTFLEDSNDVVQRFGVLGIGNLAVSRESHQELFDVGAVAALLPVTKSPDALTKRALAFSLNNISANAANHSACERLGLVRTLVGL